jgi:radical SAM superfamily enzyme YgiQ (UPF0313 family)
MKILFIDPPFHRFMGFYRFYYPLGLAYMSAVLTEKGHECLIYDAEQMKGAVSQSWSEASENYRLYMQGTEDEHHEVWKELRQVLDKFSPDLVGITMLSVKVPSAFRAAAVCKTWNPDLPVVTGGDHATVFPEKALQNHDFDIVVRGEGEMTILDVVEHLENGKRLHGIAGISFREDGEIIHNAPRPLIRDLDSLPFPMIEALMGVGSYRPVDFGAIMASRGCPYDCTFCGVFNIWSKKARFRAPSHVILEIKYLYDKYGTHYFSFRDASFTINRKWVEELCAGMMNLGYDIQWECLTRPDLLDEPMVQLMQQAGCVTIRLGIESGSPELLKKMKKRMDLDEVRKAAVLLNKYQFYWSAYFLFGTPDETPETMQETMAFINEIDPPFVTIARFAPIPGTEMYDDLVKSGRIDPDTNWGKEGNQQKHTHYAVNFSEGEFDRIMDETVALIEAHNDIKSALMNRRDGRMD